MGVLGACEICHISPQDGAWNAQFRAKKRHKLCAGHFAWQHAEDVARLSSCVRSHQSINLLGLFVFSVRGQSAEEELPPLRNPGRCAQDIVCESLMLVFIAP